MYAEKLSHQFEAKKLSYIFGWQRLIKTLKVQKMVSFSFSKAKIVGGFVASTLLVLLFLCGSILSLIWGNVLNTIVGVFFLGLLFLWWQDQYKFLWNYLQGLPALQLTPQALIDNINNISFSWKDIRSFNDASVNIGKGSKKPYIAIDLYNDVDYIPLKNSWKKRVVARLNSRFFGGSFSIETNAINDDHVNVLKALNDFKEKYST